jgi:hypothetical protein
MARRGGGQRGAKGGGLIGPVGIGLTLVALGWVYFIRRKEKIENETLSALSPRDRAIAERRIWIKIFERQISSFEKELRKAKDPEGVAKFQNGIEVQQYYIEEAEMEIGCLLDGDEPSTFPLHCNDFIRDYSNKRNKVRKALGYPSSKWR